MNTIVCPGCGRSVTADPDSDTRVICPGCGKSLTRFPGDSEPHGPSTATQVVPASLPQPQSSRSSPAARRRFSNQPLFIGAVVIAALCLLGGAVFVGYSLHGSTVVTPAVPQADLTWEQQHRAEFYSLKAEAESLVLAGDLKGGHEKYRELQLLAGSHPVHDPALFDLITDAKASQERVYGMLLTKQETALGYYNPALENPPTVKPAATQPIATAPKVQPLYATAVSPPPAPPAVVAPPSSEPAPVVTASPPAAVTPEPAVPVTVPSPARTPALPPAAVFAGHEADRQIGIALDRGINFLISKFANGQINDGQPVDSVQHQGLDALCVYALLHASEGSPDPRLSIHGPLITEAIQVLKSFPLATDPTKAMSPVVYARSLRAAALAVYNRAEDRQALRDDVAWLIKAANNGAYTYDDRYAGLTDTFDKKTELGPLAEQGGSSPPMVIWPTTQRSTPPIAFAGNPLTHRASGSAGGAGGGGTGTLKPERYVIAHFPNQVAHPPNQRARVANEDPTIMHVPPGGLHIGRHVNVGSGGGVGGGSSSIIPVFDNGETPPIRIPPPIIIPTQPPPKYDPLQTDTPTGPAYPQFTGPAPWDNSNSQYGLLGVWSGAEAGVEVPTAYWKAVEKHWLGCELSDGQWFYANGAPTGTLSMTCAGIASLLVTHEWLDAPALGTRVGRPPYSPGLAQGLKWLETGDHVTTIFTPDLHYLGYTVYGIERCALASGFKFFGTHDWYTEIAGQIIPYQAANGSWGRTSDGPEALIDTAYTVLFLTRGRHPVMMNKLRVEPFWDNRPRDLANLTRFASKELERPLNWQVVSFERPWSDWMDAPILYIASHQAMKLTDDDISKLRGYADAGGLIFTHADSATSDFNTFAQDLAKKLWPQYPMVEMPANHPLFSVNYHLADPPKLKMVTNGSRILMIHSPGDLSAVWQERMTRGKEKETFQFGVNLFIWAAGRNNFRNRLDSPYIAEPTGFPTATINVARIKYDGNWDPEPYAWTRFSRYFQWTTSIAIKPTTVELKNLKPGDAPIAVITGNMAAVFSDAEIAAAKSFVEAGGTLLIDDCGGSAAFAHSAESLLIAKAFPKPLAPVSLNDPLIAGGLPNLDNLTKPALRGYATETLGNADAPTVQTLTFGKGKVIYSRLDLTTGLLGTTSWGINGYTPGYCEALVKNALLTSNR
jgi:hypothetical protein